METYSLEEIKTIILSLNPLKRVKFISRRSFRSPPCCYNFCLNPLKRVKFISIISIINSGIGLIQRVSIPSNGSSLFQTGFFQPAYRRIKCLNPLKRVKFISTDGSPIVSDFGNGLNPLKRVKFISIWRRWFIC